MKKNSIVDLPKTAGNKSGRFYLFLGFWALGAVLATAYAIAGKRGSVLGIGTLHMVVLALVGWWLYFQLSDFCYKIARLIRSMGIIHTMIGVFAFASYLHGKSLIVAQADMKLLMYALITTIIGMLAAIPLDVLGPRREAIADTVTDMRNLFVSASTEIGKAVGGVRDSANSLSLASRSLTQSVTSVQTDIAGAGNTLKNQIGSIDLAVSEAITNINTGAQRVTKAAEQVSAAQLNLDSFVASTNSAASSFENLSRETQQMLDNVQSINLSTDSLRKSTDSLAGSAGSIESNSQAVAAAIEKSAQEILACSSQVKQAAERIVGTADNLDLNTAKVRDANDALGELASSAKNATAAVSTIEEAAVKTVEGAKLLQKFIDQGTKIKADIDTMVAQALGRGDSHG